MFKILKRQEPVAAIKPVFVPEWRSKLKSGLDFIDTLQTMPAPRLTEAPKPPQIRSYEDVSVTVASARFIAKAGWHGAAALGTAGVFWGASVGLNAGLAPAAIALAGVSLGLVGAFVGYQLIATIAWLLCRTGRSMSNHSAQADIAKVFKSLAKANAQDIARACADLKLRSEEDLYRSSPGRREFIEHAINRLKAVQTQLEGKEAADRRPLETARDELLNNAFALVIFKNIADTTLHGEQQADALTRAAACEFPTGSQRDLLQRVTDEREAAKLARDRLAQARMHMQRHPDFETQRFVLGALKYLRDNDPLLSSTHTGRDSLNEPIATLEAMQPLRNPCGPSGDSARALALLPGVIHLPHEDDASNAD